MASYLSMIGIQPDDTDRQYYWNDLSSAEVVNSGEEYHLILPDPVSDHDPVYHPNHYISNDGVEAWDVIDAFISDMNGVEGYYTGVIMKYLMRWKHKNGLEDLKKASNYLDRLIDKIEDEQ